MGATALIEPYVDTGTTICTTCNHVFHGSKRNMNAVSLGEAVKKIISRKKGGIDICSECGHVTYSEKKNAHIVIKPDGVYYEEMA